MHFKEEKIFFYRFSLYYFINMNFIAPFKMKTNLIELLNYSNQIQDINYLLKKNSNALPSMLFI